MHLSLPSIFVLSFILPSMAYEQTVLKDDSFTPQVHSKPSLADLLTVESTLSIFYDYARELELSGSFTNEEANLTILAPTNEAVMALKRKPHQGPETVDDEVHISEEEHDRMSNSNVERWVSGHIIPSRHLDLDSLFVYQTLLEGTSVTFKPITKKDRQDPAWKRVTVDDGIKILKMREASNGELFIIDTCIVST